MCFFSNSSNSNRNFDDLIISWLGEIKAKHKQFVVLLNVIFAEHIPTVKSLLDTRLKKVKPKLLF